MSRVFHSNFLRYLVKVTVSFNPFGQKAKLLVSELLHSNLFTYIRNWRKFSWIWQSEKK